MLFASSLSIVTSQLADQMLLESAQRSSEQELLEQQMLEDKLRAADWETTEDEMVREVAQKSFSEYLRHQEEQARQASAVSRCCYCLKSVSATKPAR